MKNAIYIVAVSILFAISGCMYSGEPPAGNIVVNDQTVPKSDPESIANSFVMACLEYNVSGKIRINADAKSLDYALFAVTEAAKIIPVTADFSGKSSWILKSFITDRGQWILQLFRGEKLIWSSKQP